MKPEVFSGIMSVREDDSTDIISGNYIKVYRIKNPLLSVVKNQMAGIFMLKQATA